MRQEESEGETFVKGCLVEDLGAEGCVMVGGHRQSRREPSSPSSPSL